MASEPLTVTLFMTCPDCKVSFEKPEDFIEHMELALCNKEKEDNTDNEISNNDCPVILERKASNEAIKEQYNIKECSVRLTNCDVVSSKEKSPRPDNVVYIKGNSEIVDFNRDENTVNVGSNHGSCANIKDKNTVDADSSEGECSIVEDFGTVGDGSNHGKDKNTVQANSSEGRKIVIENTYTFNNGIIQSSKFKKAKNTVNTGCNDWNRAIKKDKKTDGSRAVNNAKEIAIINYPLSTLTVIPKLVANTKGLNTINAGQSQDQLFTFKVVSVQSKDGDIKYLNTVDAGSSDGNSKDIKDIPLAGSSIQCNSTVDPLATSPENNPLEEPETGPNINCSICDKTFSGKFNLNRHIKNVHISIKPFQCEVSGCKERFKYAANIKRHVRTVHSKPVQVNIVTKPKFPCTLCDKTFCDQSGVNRHIKSAHAFPIPDGPYKCEQCRERFDTAWNLQNHVDTAHPRIKQYECSQCELKFSTDLAIVQHMQTHHAVNRSQHDILPYECQQCTKKFSYRSGLTRHMKEVHQDMEPYECDQCKDKFSTASDLQSHVDSVHLKLQMHGCVQCGRQYANSYTLNHHIDTVHLKINETNCSICDKTFADKSQLKRHVENVHLEIKEHECEHCGKKFAQKSNYQWHLKTVHSKIDQEVIKRNECIHCKQIFGTAMELVQHVQCEHSNVQMSKNVCTICGKTFCDEFTLNRHVKIVHLEIKAFECEHCNKKLTTASNLQNHMINFHLNVAKNSENIEDTFKDPIKTELDENREILDSMEIEIEPGQLFNHGTTKDKNRFKTNQCKICKKGFYDKSTLNRHIKSTHLAKTCICKLCDKGFPDTIGLNHHIRSVHLKIKDFECRYDGCGLTFTTEYILDTHVNSVHKNGMKRLSANIGDLSLSLSPSSTVSEKTTNSNHAGRCTICNQHFADLYSLNHHIDVSHPNIDPYGCEQCNERFSTESNLKAHVDSVHLNVQSIECNVQPNVNDFKTCSVCNKSFANQYQLNRHVAVHLKNKSHDCELCNEQFSTDSKLEAHIDSVHHNVEKHGCIQCGKQFITSLSLETHLDKVHLNITEKVCSICNKSFADQYQLTRHVKIIHLKFKTHECEHCKKRFSSISILKCHVINVHRNIEDGENIEEDDIEYLSTVNAGSSDDNSLANTVTVASSHTGSINTVNSLASPTSTDSETSGEKKCPICDKKFSQSSCMSRHVDNVHLGLKLHKCEHCGKKFSTASNLKVHVKTVHLNIKQYPCLHCEMEFSRPNYREDHVKKMHPNVPKSEDKCKMCDEQFDDQAGLYVHIQKVHMKMNTSI